MTKMHQIMKRLSRINLAQNKRWSSSKMPFKMVLLEGLCNNSKSRNLVR